jgi:peptide/nickel transport system substrate-binding protein
MKKSIAFAIGTVLVLTFTLFGCGGKAPSTSGEVLKVATSQDPKDLHPYKRVSSQILRINNQILEPLVQLGKENNSYVPALATEWKYVDDGKALQFKIRKGVKFHNGETMTADDIIFSFKAASKETASSGGINWLDWDGIKALDDSTIYMPFKYVNSIALGYLATTNLYIISKKAYTELGDKFGSGPVGTGPYKVTEWLSGDHITLTAFEGYWGGQPKIKTIIFRFIPEASQAMIELETGGIDVTLDIGGKDIDRVESSQKFKIIKGKSVTNDFIYFNTSKPPFDNKIVRQAVAHAIDKQAILKAIYQGKGNVAYGPLTTDTWAFDQSLKTNPPYSFDLNKAKELMAKAGLAKGGITVEFFIDDKSTRVSGSEIIKNQLSQIGITANIHSFDYATFFNILYKGEEDNLYLNGSNASTGEPDKLFYQIMHKDFAVTGGPNMMRFKNDRFSKLLDEARASTDDALKLKNYTEAQQIFMDEVPGIPYYQRDQICAARKDVQGIRTVGESFDLTRMYIGDK